MRSRSVLVLCASLTLVACIGNGLSDLEAYARQVMAREPGPIEPLPKIKRIETFIFDPASPRDPFVLDRQSDEAIAAAGGISPNPSRRKEELEQFPLDSLSMVGTLEQADVMWALVLTPERSLHHVRVGNYMGQNNGQITRITEEEIELTEILSDGAGAWRESQATVALSQ